MAEITVVDVAPQTVAGIRKQGNYREIPVLLGEVVHYVMEKGLEFAGPPVYLCHEKDKEEVAAADEAGTADIEVAFPVTGTAEDVGDIRIYEIPGGKMAKTFHKGPYEECESTYDALFAWIVENGMQITGPIREVYVNDPREIPPEEILTEIYAPVG